MFDYMFNVNVIIKIIGTFFNSVNVCEILFILFEKQKFNLKKLKKVKPKRKVNDI